MEGFFIAPNGQKFYGKPRTLYIDIETAPSLGYVWGKWEQNVIEFKRSWFILSFSHRWGDETTTHVHSLRQYKGYKQDKFNDRALMLDLRDIMESADIIVSHNGDRFDFKKIRTRFFINKLRFRKGGGNFISIDLLKMFRSLFAFDSNKQDDLGKELETGRKLATHGKNTWLGCYAGDPKEWSIMEKYNIADVELLYRNAQRLFDWIPEKSNRRKPITVKSLL